MQGLNIWEMQGNCNSAKTLATIGAIGECLGGDGLIGKGYGGGEKGRNLEGTCREFRLIRTAKETDSPRNMPVLPK